MRARAATPSQVCSAPSWHTPIMGTLWGSPPSVGRRAPPHSAVHGERWPGLDIPGWRTQGARICV